MVEAEQHRLAWDEQGYSIDGRPAFLISGEFHYFRVPREDCERRLSLFSLAGGNCVATYIPWGLHEPEEGDIRFGDCPERDLEGFLKLCRQMGLMVIARPGPYAYSELTYDGLPGWLCEGYQELLAKDASGKAFRVSSVSYLHPLLLEKAGRWLDAACSLLSGYTVDRGGPIVMVQLDNELLGIHTWFGGFDHHPVTLGLGREDGRLAVFLKERYRYVERLNDAWGTSYRCFSEAKPAEKSSGGDMYAAARRLKDFRDLCYRMLGEYLSWLAARARKAGLCCGFAHNAANPGMNSWFREAAGVMGRDMLLGSDHYYNLNQGWPQNNPTPQYAVKAMYSCGLLAGWGYPPTVLELPAGSFSDWPPITVGDLACCYGVNLAFGMKGLNYYIFTGGPNPINLGRFDDVYDYGAPVSAEGALRESYDIIRGFNEDLNTHPWLGRAHRVCDFHIGLINSYARPEGGEGEPTNFYGGAAAFDFMLKGIIPSALCTSLSPGFLDLEGLPSKESVSLPIIVPAATVMPQASQLWLRDFVQSGGQLLIGPVIPWLDENYRPCTLFRDILGADEVIPVTDSLAATIDGLRVHVYNHLWRMPEPDGAVALGHVSDGGCIAWQRDFEGGGRVIWLGLDWFHGKRVHGEMLAQLLKRLGISTPAVQCSNPNVWTALHTDGKRRRLYLMNLFTSPMEAAVSIWHPGGSCDYSARWTLPPITVKAVDLSEL